MDQALSMVLERIEWASELQKNGIQPFPDRITDFLMARDVGKDAGAQRGAAEAA